MEATFLFSLQGPQNANCIAIILPCEDACTNFSEVSFGLQIFLANPGLYEGMWLCLFDLFFFESYTGK